MKYSIVLPYYDPEYRKSQMFTYLLESIVKCSQGFDYEFIIVKDGRSYVESHNIGLRNAKGDYVIVVNDDILIQDEKWLDKLTTDGIASYALKGENGFPEAACFGMPRNVIEKIGYMDEEYKDGFNYEDTDYFMRAKQAGIPFYDGAVKLKHYGSQTFEKYFGNDQEMIRRNREIFNKKWHNT